jgi:hypothetical protein
LDRLKEENNARHRQILMAWIGERISWPTAMMRSVAQNEAKRQMMMSRSNDNWISTNIWIECNQMRSPPTQEHLKLQRLPH